MLPSNIEIEVEKILKKNNGWLRTEECSKVYSKGDKTRRTQFYRWHKKVKKSKIKGFQVLSFPENVSFIGLDSADPKILNKILSNDKQIVKSIRSGFGVFDYLKWRSESKKQERRRKERELLVKRITYLELGEKIYGKDAKALKEWAEIEKKNLKEMGLDKE